MKNPNLLREALPSGERRWIDVKDMPIARSTTYRALREGWFDSVTIQFPGSRRKRRFIDRLSVDRWLERLMAEQKLAKQHAEAEAAKLKEGAI
jgi:hypothetical protein